MSLFELPVAIGEIMSDGSGPLPDPDLVNFYKLAEKRIIYLDFDVDIDVMAIHRQIMLWNMEDRDIEIDKRQPIKLVIYSPGGYMGHMWAIVDLINASKTPVWTINIGQASSAAFLIFVSGKKRLMTKNAVCVVHEGAAQMDGDAVKVMDAATTYKEDLKRMKQYIVDHTGIPMRMLTSQKANDWTISADKCLELKACDQLIGSLDDVF